MMNEGERGYEGKIRSGSWRHCSPRSRGDRDTGRNRRRGEESEKQILESVQGKSEVVFREKTYGDLTIHRIENLGFTNLAVAFMRSILGDPFTTIRTLYRFCRMKDGFSSVADNISTRTKCDGKTQMKHINQITAQRCIIVPIGDSDEHMRCVEEFQAKSNTQQLAATCGIPHGVSNLFLL